MGTKGEDLCFRWMLLGCTYDLQALAAIEMMFSKLMALRFLGPLDFWARITGES